VRRILFVSESCLLDRKSGAAQSVRAQLKALAQAGWYARAVTLALFDGEAEYDRAGAHPPLPERAESGSEVRVDDDGLQHTLCWTHSSRHKALRPWDWRQFMGMAQAALDEFKPDVLLTYRSPLLSPLLAQAQQRGVRTVFYLGNPGYARAEASDLKFIDEFVVPSQAMADLYRDKRGWDARVLPTLVEPPMDGRINLEPARVAQRTRERFVTMINPEPAKGGLFFLNLVEQARVLAPGVRFRAVQSRCGREDWARQGMTASILDQVDWVDHTQDMGRVFEQAALLLVPSLWFEAAGRVAAEALLSGVPVLAMRSGGLEQQVNGGGFMFDLPPALQADHLAAPDKEDLHQWLHFIRVLMSDDAVYTQAVRLALKASALHEPARARARVVSLYQFIANKPLLPGLLAHPEMQWKLQDQRSRMQEALAAANEKVERTAAISGDLQDSPYGPVLEISLNQPAIRDAINALKSKDLDRARAILEQFLRVLPEDITALGLLADVADGQDKEGEARRLMERVVSLAPGFAQGHQQLMRYLRASGDVDGALVHSLARLERAPNHPRYLAMHAALLVRANRFDDAIRVYEALFRQRPGGAQDWMQYALALKTLGQQEAGVAAYRKAIGMAPGNGRAWHALSNTKLAVFTPDDVGVMEQQLLRSDLEPEDRYNLHFTLGKAHEDAKAYAPSFEHYAKANAVRRGLKAYDVSRVEDFVAQAKETFSRAFFEARAGIGHSAADPIFIVGLHRAGSTLTEQILASHSQVEGTRELPHLLRIGRDFGGVGVAGGEQGLQRLLLADLTPVEWAALGAQYLQTTRHERQTPRPRFTDKMPANWMYTGLIHLMLPNAKIIDIRRKPMAAGFALFKMNFGRGVDHSYDQEDIARYYVAYADLMAHFDAVLPGRVHHLQYENLVQNTEEEIRRLIDYCALPFEASCLRYWETERAVQTPSSEQVRQPIFSSSVEQWRHYEPWLGPMKQVFATAPWLNESGS